MKLLQVIFCSVCICLSPDGYKKNRSSIICYAWVLWNENDPTFWFNAPTFSPFVCYAPLSFLSVNGSCFASYIYLCYISFLFIKMQFNLKTVFYLLLQKLWKVCWLHQWVSRKWTLDKKKKKIESANACSSTIDEFRGMLGWWSPVYCAVLLHSNPKCMHRVNLTITVGAVMKEYAVVCLFAKAAGIKTQKCKKAGCL